MTCSLLVLRVPAGGRAGSNLVPEIGSSDGFLGFSQSLQTRWLVPLPPGPSYPPIVTCAVFGASGM
jgi:hypothetical protein